MTGAIDYFADAYPPGRNVFPSETFPSGPAATIFCSQTDGFTFDLYKKCLETHKYGSNTWGFPSKSPGRPPGSGGVRFKSCAIEPIAVGAAAAQSVSTLAQFVFGLRTTVFSFEQRVFPVNHDKKKVECPGYRVEISFRPLERLPGGLETHRTGRKLCAKHPVALCADAVRSLFGLILSCAGAALSRTDRTSSRPAVKIVLAGLVPGVSRPGGNVKGANSSHPDGERTKRNVNIYFLKGEKSCVGHGFHIPGRFTWRRC